MRAIDRDDVQPHGLAEPNLDAFSRKGVTRELDVDGSGRMSCLVHQRDDEGKSSSRAAVLPTRPTLRGD